MIRIALIYISLVSLASCTNRQSAFNSPSDYQGGSKEAAIASHCKFRGSKFKEGMAYKLCKESFNTHYGYKN